MHRRSCEGQVTSGGLETPTENPADDAEDPFLSFPLRSERSVPSRRTAPLVEGSTWQIIRPIVDFPLPILPPNRTSHPVQSRTRRLTRRKQLLFCAESTFPNRRSIHSPNGQPSATPPQVSTPQRSPHVRLIFHSIDGDLWRWRLARESVSPAPCDCGRSTRRDALRHFEQRGLRLGTGGDLETTAPRKRHPTNSRDRSGGMPGMASSAMLAL